MENKELIKKALEAQKMSYSPYSNFSVGAAVLTKDGKVYTGCNIEIASYSPTICAERTAIFKAISEGSQRIQKIAVVGDANPTFPCGVCRQVIREFGKDAEVIIANSEDEFSIYTINELLPHSFGPEDLDKKEEEDEKHV